MLFKLPESVENSAQHFISDGDIDDGTGSSDNISFLDISVVSEHDNTDIVGFQVQCHTSDTWAELNHFSCLDLGQAEHSGDTVSNGNDSSEFLDVILRIKIEINIFANSIKRKNKRINGFIYLSLFFFFLVKC